MKRILTLIFTCITSFTAIAQYTYGEPVDSKGGGGDLKKTRLGLFIAPNNSWMKPTASKSNDGLYKVATGGSKIGYSWGLMLDQFFTDNYGIATGLALNTTGGKINAEYDATKLPNATPDNLVKAAEFDYRLQYFEIPFGLKLMSDDIGGGLRVFGNLGITAAIGFGKKATYTVIYTDSVAGKPVDKTVTGENEKLLGGLAIRPILFQMNLGAGIEYQLTEKMSFYVGLFFNNGFAPDVTNPKQLDMGFKGTFDDGSVRINNMALKIGMFF